MPEVQSQLPHVSILAEWNKIHKKQKGSLHLWQTRQALLFWLLVIIFVVTKGFSEHLRWLLHAPGEVIFHLPRRVAVFLCFLFDQIPRSKNFLYKFAQPTHFLVRDLLSFLTAGTLDFPPFPGWYGILVRSQAPLSIPRSSFKCLQGPVVRSIFAIPPCQAYVDEFLIQACVI